jgi:hypothetical protein
LTTLTETAQAIVEATTPAELDVWIAALKLLAEYYSKAPRGMSPQQCSAELLVALCAVETARFEKGNRWPDEIH